MSSRKRILLGGSLVIADATMMVFVGNLLVDRLPGVGTGLYRYSL